MCTTKHVLYEHMNLICQAHESLKRYCFQYSEINQNVRKYHEEEAVKLQNNVKEQIDPLNKKFDFLHHQNCKIWQKEGKDDEGVVGVIHWQQGNVIVKLITAPQVVNCKIYIHE